jgi:hypothetical protein
VAAVMLVLAFLGLGESPFRIYLLKNEDMNYLFI